MKLPMAENPVFDTIQGEGQLSGVPMTFIRLGGCSVGCPECDTDYGVKSRLDVPEILRHVTSLPPREWVWVTGGEPCDHDTRPLAAGLRAAGRKVAMATSGKYPLGVGWNGWHEWADWLYVSPHHNAPPAQPMGNEINVVPGLNGLLLAEVAKWDVRGFPRKTVTPCDGHPDTLAECVEFVKSNAGWRLGVQAHKVWELP